MEKIAEVYVRKVSNGYIVNEDKKILVFETEEKYLLYMSEYFMISSLNEDINHKFKVEKIAFGGDAKRKLQ